MTTDELKEFFHVMVEDCGTGAKIWGENPCGYTRRSYARAVFALIDGNTYRLKQLCVYAYEKGAVSLSAKQLIQMNETNGFRETTAKNIKILFKIFSEVQNKDNPLDANSKEWQEFLECFNIRHRITHPKAAKDLHLSLDDMKNLEASVDFYRDITIKLISF